MMSVRLLKFISPSVETVSFRKSVKTLGSRSEDGTPSQRKKREPPKKGKEKENEDRRVLFIFT